MRGYWGISVFIALTLLVPLTVLAHGTTEVIMRIGPTGYEPRDVTIPLNATVVFINETADDRWPASNIHPTHAIYAEFDPRSPIAPGQSWRFTFRKAGIWTYHDHLYPAVTGTITVTDTDYLDTWRSAFQKIYTTFFAVRLPSYSFDPAILADSTALYTDPNSLYSYIRLFGLPRTMAHLTTLANSQGSCHDAAHKAGRIAYEMKGDQAFTQCTAACHSGCYHGATESFFRERGTANLTANLELICHSELNSFVSHQCLHGIGHGLMAWANYEIHEALRACDLLERGRDSCYTGVFMENVVGSLEQGESGHYATYVNDNPQYPCTVVEETYKSSCYFYQTSRMLQLFGLNWPRLAAACAAAPTRFHRHCFESMGRDVGGVYASDIPGAIAACQAVPTPDTRIFCLTGAVQNYFWEPSGQPAALRFCQLLPDAAEHAACLDTVAQRAALLGLP